MTFSGIAQTFEIYKGDTINRIDNYNCKQGWWRITGKIKPPGTCYMSDQLAEEGIYLNNRKTGLWIEYFCNGNKKSVLVFKDGRPGGSATIYFENGVVSETGTWKNNRWIGNHKMYDTFGFLTQEIEYDTLGKRSGNFLVPLDDAREPMTLKETNKSNNGPVVLQGKQTLYNKHKQITKDGVFKDNKFMDGKAYIYDDNGDLIRIAIYKDGAYVGDAPIKK